MKQLIAFDLDGTLAQSKQAIDAEMGALLAALTGVAEVAVISGGDWPQFEAQLVANLPESAAFARLWLLPTSGTKLYRFDGGWRQAHAEDFDADERRRVLAALDQAVAEVGLDKDRSWGEKIEDRGSQITFSGLGQQAPLSAKETWDPDLAKRKRLQALLRARLPGFSINIGGSTSIDVTREGVDKAYGMRRLSEQSGVPADAILFLGDAVFPGGNDYPVRAAGIDTVAVRDVEESKRVIEAIVACLKRP